MHRSWLALIATTLFLTILAWANIQPAQAQPPITATTTVLAADATRMVMELVTPPFTVNTVTHDGATFATVALPDLPSTMLPGQPQLPVYATLLGVPPGAQVSVHILDSETVTGQLPATILPAPTVTVVDDPGQALPQPGGHVYPPDPLIYGRSAWWPAAPAVVSAVSEWRGQQVTRLQIFPLQVNPVTGAVRQYTRLRVEVRFTGGGSTVRSTAQVAADGPYEAILRDALLNYDAARAWRSTPGRHTQPPSTNTGASRMLALEQWYRVGVKEDGLYGITCTDLTNAGINAATVELSTVRLLAGGTEGNEVPLLITNSNNSFFCDQDDVIEFWAQGGAAKYATENIYWLTYGGGAGLRMTSRTPSAGTTLLTTTTVTLRLEQNRYYRPQTPRVENYEHWFWDILTTNNPRFPRTRSYTLTLDAPLQGVATLQATLAGMSDFGHRTQVAVNGVQLSNASWSGYGLYNPPLTAPAGLLVAGANVISITNATGWESLVAVDHLVVTGVQTARASGDALTLHTPGAGNWRIQAGNFSSAAVRVFDVTTPGAVTQIANASTGRACPCTIEFSDQTSGPRTYYALTAAARRSPSSIVRDTVRDIRTSATGADYVIIAHPSTLAAAAPLAAQRAAQGLRVATFSVQDVYDAFSGGVVDPQAIHDFLAYAYANWPAPAPTYVLLLGDGHYDPKGYCVAAAGCDGIVTPPAALLVPPYLRMVDPWIGETAADNLLVTFGGLNTLPDMAIGRLPANNAAEAEQMVAKILAYEQTPTAGAWRSRMTFVTDNAYQTTGAPDPAGNFWALSDAIANDPALAPPTMTTRRLYFNVCDPSLYPQCTLPNPPYAPYTTAVSMTTAIVGAINEGSVLVNYVGHAAIRVWGSPVIFSTSNVATLANGARQPVMLDFTCYTGYYHNPQASSAGLAEVMMRQADGGAIAGWASSGLSVVDGHDHMNRGFLRAAVSQGVRQVGLAAQAGLAELYTSGGGAFLENLATYHIIGDPAMAIAFEGAAPAATATPTVTKTPVPPTATATGTATRTFAPPTATGTATATRAPVPPTATATGTATRTPAPPTATGTATATRTPVPPTATATGTATHTPVPPTATATDTATRTPVPPNATATHTPAPPTATATGTSTATATRTSVPPTATATATGTATRTPVPPTATGTATRTQVPPTPTATATGTATRTPVPPTATATGTATRTPASPTATGTATATRTPVPPTATATGTATRTPAPPTATGTATATRTPVPPTATATSTPTATHTPLPPTATATGTATATSTPALSSGTATSTPPATATPTVTATGTTTATPEPRSDYSVYLPLVTTGEDLAE